MPLAGAVVIGGNPLKRRDMWDFREVGQGRGRL